MHIIGSGNINLSSFHHLISYNKVLIFMVFLQLLMGHGKFSAFDSSNLFIVYSAVTITPVNIVSGRSGIFLPGKGNAVLIGFSFCKEYSKFKEVNILSFQFRLVGLLDRENTLLKCNPVIWV